MTSSTYFARAFSSKGTVPLRGLRPPVLTSNISADDIHQLTDEIKNRFLNDISKITSYTDLSQALGRAAEASAVVTLPSMTHDDAETRLASTKAKDELKTLFDQSLADPKLYKVLLSLPFSSSDVNPRSDGDEHFKDLLLGLFRRNGCALDEQTSDRDVLLNKRQKIEETCSEFSSCINENNDYLEFTSEELHGVENIEQYPLIENSNKRKVSLKAPDTMPILQFATKSTTRQKVAVAVAGKCQEENTSRFIDVLRLRNECAKLMGYKSHAHFMLEAKMVGTPEAAEEFLLGLLHTAKNQCQKDLSVLLELKQKEEEEEPTGDDDDETPPTIINQWDVPYYIRQYKATLGVDEAEIRKYFPLNHVKETILAIYEELLTVKFDRVDNVEDVWHSDVECYAVKKEKTNDDDKVDDDSDDGILGYFFLDLFPRPGKYAHQCVYPLRPSYNDVNNQIIKPSCVNIGNLTPNQKDGQPSYLRFREVETFFHEFGHVMHCVLSESQHSLQAWAWSAVPWPGGVEQDFLEVPSMMLENFVWQPEILQRLSQNLDGQPLPRHLIDAICKNRFVMQGYTRTRYLAMSLYDLKVHIEPGPLYSFEGNEYDAVSLYNVMQQTLTGVPYIENCFPGASWYHPMMGYDAGYYGYIYSEVFAADLFSKFEELETTVIDKDLGKKYREAILSPCATHKGENLLQNFLGRNPSMESFLKHMATDVDIYAAK